MRLFKKRLPIYEIRIELDEIPNADVRHRERTAIEKKLKGQYNVVVIYTGGHDKRKIKTRIIR